MRCAFCDADAVAECCWPVEKFFFRRYEQLELGDRVRRAVESPTLAQRPPAVVWYLERRGAYIHVGLTIGSRIKTFDALSNSRVRAAKLAPCQIAVCHDHMCERGPGAVYCQSHWRAWEAVA